MLKSIWGIASGVSCIMATVFIQASKYNDAGMWALLAILAALWQIEAAISERKPPV